MAVNMTGAQQRGPAIDVTVTIPGDTIDVNPGDGVCADHLNNCSLRAAIMEANRAEPGSVIRLPFLDDFYFIEQAVTGEDTDATGDFDILNSMSIINESNQMLYLWVPEANFGAFDIKDTGMPITVNLTGLTIYGGHRETENGGGVRIAGSQTTVNLTNVDIAAGRALNGGGIAVENGATLNMKQGSIFFNRFYNQAGGLFVTSNGVARLANVTFTRNEAYDPNPQIGGSIVIDSGWLFLNNVTVAVNRGGGLRQSGGIVTLNNTILANNEMFDCSGAITSSGNNVIENINGCSITGGANDVFNTDPGLLEDYLSTQFVVDSTNISFPLLETSPAYNAGNPATCEPVDQRGVDRPQGGQCDIGAHEGYVRSLILNPGFETRNPVKPKLPASWKLNGLTTKDKIVCNTADKLVTFDGACAFSLTPLNFATKLVKQSVTTSDFTTDDGVVFTLSLGVLTPHQELRLKGKLKIVYSDSTLTPDVYTLKMDMPASDFQPSRLDFGLYSIVLPSAWGTMKGDVAQVIVSVKPRLVTKRFFIDSAYVHQIENQALGYVPDSRWPVLPAK